MHHVSHHILPSSLPPRDSNWWICDIIKHPVVSSLYTSLCHPAPSSFPFDPLTSICSVLPIAPHDPICPQVQGGCYQRYLEVLSLFPSLRLPYPHNPPSTHPPHTNTSTAIQDGRIMNCSWRLRGARGTKGFLLSCIPLLPPFLLTNNMLWYTISILS